MGTRTRTRTRTRKHLLPPLPTHLCFRFVHFSPQSSMPLSIRDKPPAQAPSPRVVTFPFVHALIHGRATGHLPLSSVVGAAKAPPMTYSTQKGAPAHPDLAKFKKQ